MQEATVPLQQLQQVEFTLEIGMTLGIVLVALALFIWNRLRLDVVALIVLALLLVLGLITPDEAVAGFSNEATITVALMLILSAGLLRTGFVDVLGSRIARLAQGRELRLLVLIVAVVVPMSAFINNTAAVAILLPMIIGLTREMDVPPSRLLMPLSYSGQLGGTLTLIGTSTNLLVAGLIIDLGVERIRLFDITPPALILVAIGVGYILTVGRRLIPDREASAELLKTYELHEYLTALIVEEDSPLAGRTLAESEFGKQHGLEVLRLDRDDTVVNDPGPDTVIRGGDMLLVEGSIPHIAEIRKKHGVEISSVREEAGAVAAEAAESESAEEAELAEVMIPPHSPLVGSTLQRAHFERQFGLTVLAILRHGHPLQKPLVSVELQGGDILLVSAPARALREAHESEQVALLQALDIPEKRRSKLKFAIPILLGVVLFPALGITRIMVSAFIGVVAMFLTGCLTPEEAYSEMDWMVVILLGAILPLGIAMQNTGAAEFLAAGVLDLTRPLGPHGILAAFFLLTMGFTSVISNNGAAVVLTPIAVATAAALELSPLPFVVAVMFGASNAFMTPIGYQTNIFVYGPGGYRFTDFVRVGTPLGLLIAAAATFVIPIFFPF
ncbi:MAG: SLC13 family permease [Longimicrobiales bacterium]